MVVSSELIVLASTKVGEKSLVIHCLSRDWGRRSFIVSLTKQINSAYFLPLNIIEAEVIENPKS
ncbi:MAG: recombination protein O N-terminal domain-containing protein, partial [Bacteroidales bacterium]|nr:recombination protein O N-terminal domain-containing protein [Bacteroidales bacterium]